MRSGTAPHGAHGTTGTWLGLFKPFPGAPGRLLVEASGRHTPEQRLLTAVLAEAIHTFQKYGFGRDRRSRRLFREAEQWLLSEDIDWPFSCENICCALGIDAAYLRSHLRRWRDDVTAMVTRSRRVDWRGM